MVRMGTWPGGFSSVDEKKRQGFLAYSLSCEAITSRSIPMIQEWVLSRLRLCWHLDLRLPAFRTVNKCSCSSMTVCDIWLCSSRCAHNFMSLLHQDAGQDQSLQKRPLSLACWGRWRTHLLAGEWQWQESPLISLSLLSFTQCSQADLMRFS